MREQSSTALLTTFSDRVMPAGKSQSSLLQNATLFTMPFISGLTVLASQTLTKPEETTGNASNKSGLTLSSRPGTVSLSGTVPATCLPSKGISSEHDPFHTYMIVYLGKGVFCVLPGHSVLLPEQNFHPPKLSVRLLSGGVIQQSSGGI